MSLDEAAKKHIKKPQKQARTSNRFIEALKDATVESLEQSAYDHAAVIVTARDGNLDFLRNISGGHREVLKTLASKEVEEKQIRRIIHPKRNLQSSKLTSPNYL
ncbi:Processing alpha glucosidase I [Hypoxylon texense]